MNAAEKKQFDEQAEKIAELQAHIEELTKANADTAGYVNDLIALKSYTAELEKTKDSQSVLINELLESQQTLEKENATGKAIFTVDKEEYELVVPRFNFNGQIWDAASLRQDQKVQRELVKIGSTVLQKKV